MKKEFLFEEFKRYMNLSNKKRNEYDNRLYNIQHRRYDSVIFAVCKIIGMFLIAVLIIETLGFLNIVWMSLMGEMVNAIIYRRNTNKQVCKLKEEFGLTDGKRL